MGWGGAEWRATEKRWPGAGQPQMPVGRRGDVVGGSDGQYVDGGIGDDDRAPDGHVEVIVELGGNHAADMKLMVLLSP